jgi:hypothetical protein
MNRDFDKFMNREQIPNKNYCSLFQVLPLLFLLIVCVDLYIRKRDIGKEPAWSCPMCGEHVNLVDKHYIKCAKIKFDKWYQEEYIGPINNLK